VNGKPSAWLAESIATAFPERVTVTPSVPVDSNGVAQVDLSESALAVAPDTMDRMFTQMQASLASVGVPDVQLSVGNTPIAAQPVSVRSTRVTGPALVLTKDGFGFLVGDQLQAVPGLSDVIKTVSPAAIQVTAQRDHAALRLTSGGVARQSADGKSDLLDARAGLVDPTIDQFNIVWSVPRAKPSAVAAFLPDGTRVNVADAWPGASQITAMAISRDGTRMAASVVAGGTTEVWIAGVVRGSDGAPKRLGAPVSLGDLVGTSVGIAWLDDETVGSLAHDGETSPLLAQLVGGPGSSTPAPAGVAAIAGASSVDTVRLRGPKGELFVRRGSNWQQTASGVIVLATQQGMPTG
jgi:hypothetical protein